MGHESLGILPKTKVWQIIVGEIAGFAKGEYEASEIASNTLFQVRKQFQNLENDPSIKTSFEFLVEVAHAFQKDEPIAYLKERNVINGEGFTPVGIAKAIKKFKPDDVKSNEYKTFAMQAAIDAVNSWYATNIERGRSLFSEEIDSKAIFYKASTGSGFCELARLFFSKFTERYLKYFLEREASSVITNIMVIR